jgi:hypothetical protein
LAEKERQNDLLREEARRAVQLQSDLEFRVDRQSVVMKPAVMQTEAIDDHLLALQDNDKLKRDLEVTRQELIGLNHSYETRLSENA